MFQKSLSYTSITSLQYKHYHESFILIGQSSEIHHITFHKLLGYVILLPVNQITILKVL